jgi:hypothetical protein
MLKRGAALRCEFRVRAVFPLHGNAADLTCGADITMIFRQ